MRVKGSIHLSVAFVMLGAVTACGRPYKPPYPPKVDLAALPEPSHVTTAEEDIIRIVELADVRIAKGGLYVDVYIHKVGTVENRPRYPANGVVARRLSDRPEEHLEARSPEGQPVEVMGYQEARPGGPATWLIWILGGNPHAFGPPSFRINDRLAVETVMVQTTEQYEQSTIMLRFKPDWPDWSDGTVVPKRWARPLDCQWREFAVEPIGE